MRLLLITLGTFVITAFVWTTLWLWGQSFTYKPYDHPLMSWTLDQQKPVLALATKNPQEASQFLEQNPQGILFLDLHISRDGRFFTSPDRALDFISKLPETDRNEYRGDKAFHYDLDFLQNHSPSLVTLNDWMKLKPKFWIFNLLDNATDIDKNIIQWVEKNNLQDGVVITSDTDLVISSIKDSKPLWIYGTSLSDLAKLLTMASVKLESIVTFKRDYFITPVTHRKRMMLNPRVISEMRRRFKKVAIGPVHTDQDREIALKMQPDILILSSETFQK